mmetsp:Transcript_15451/g.33454  ORF Transcript_15451/g.33454 Transcript_15451/m.33454 type:complete len:1872 (+) Transcript_15451:150-5765(+)|eukprot:CAMPEP_0172297986 /NCGR_PEP_ID=MMETSP1058-20130122/824_1 /TAXON_ID=83371 /ORGANISM="Detonula confervacea, Strain CCMP 353" /LENGTH=1871 /DNA_ID=CAMNT_0013007215 /DNA_START=65 /DNA_END=5680 /DNA_ORIENTATION=-
MGLLRGAPSQSSSSEEAIPNNKDASSPSSSSSSTTTTGLLLRRLAHHDVNHRNVKALVQHEDDFSQSIEVHPSASVGLNDGEGEEGDDNKLATKDDEDEEKKEEDDEEEEEVDNKNEKSGNKESDGKKAQKKKKSKNADAVEEVVKVVENAAKEVPPNHTAVAKEETADNDETESDKKEKEKGTNNKKSSDKKSIVKEEDVVLPKEGSIDGKTIATEKSADNGNADEESAIGKLFEDNHAEDEGEEGNNEKSTDDKEEATKVEKEKDEEKEKDDSLLSARDEDDALVPEEEDATATATTNGKEGEIINEEAVGNTMEVVAREQEEVTASVAAAADGEENATVNNGTVKSDAPAAENDGEGATLGSAAGNSAMNTVKGSAHDEKNEGGSNKMADEDGESEDAVAGKDDTVGGEDDVSDDEDGSGGKGSEKKTDDAVDNEKREDLRGSGKDAKKETVDSEDARDEAQEVSKDESTDEEEGEAKAKLLKDDSIASKEEEEEEADTASIDDMETSDKKKNSAKDDSDEETEVTAVSSSDEKKTTSEKTKSKDMKELESKESDLEEELEGNESSDAPKEIEGSDEDKSSSDNVKSDDGSADDKSDAKSSNGKETDASEDGNVKSSDVKSSNVKSVEVQATRGEWGDDDDDDDNVASDIEVQDTKKKSVFDESAGPSQVELAATGQTNASEDAVVETKVSSEDRVVPKMVNVETKGTVEGDTDDDASADDAKKPSKHASEDVVSKDASEDDTAKLTEEQIKSEVGSWGADDDEVKKEGGSGTITKSEEQIESEIESKLVTALESGTIDEEEAEELEEEMEEALEEGVVGVFEEKLDEELGERDEDASEDASEDAEEGYAAPGKVATVSLSHDKYASSILVDDPPVVGQVPGTVTGTEAEATVADAVTNAAGQSFDNPNCTDDPTGLDSTTCEEIKELDAGAGCDSVLFTVDTTADTAEGGGSGIASFANAAAVAAEPSASGVGVGSSGSTSLRVEEEVASAATEDAKDAADDDDYGIDNRRLKDGMMEDSSDNEATNNSEDNEASAEEYAISDTSTSNTTVESEKIVVTVGSRYCPETCSAVPQCEKARNHFHPEIKLPQVEDEDESKNVEVATATASADVSAGANNASDDGTVDNDSTNIEGNGDGADDLLEEKEAEEGVGADSISTGNTFEVSCVDDPAFLYKDKPGIDCAYIAKNKPEKCLKLHGGEKVGVTSCPESCDMVDECEEIGKGLVIEDKDSEDVNVTVVSSLGNNGTYVGSEGANTDVVDESPSELTGNITAMALEVSCKDDVNFLYKNKPEFTCEYIAAKKPDKCLKLHDGEQVGVVSCPKSCGMVKECEAMYNVSGVEKSVGSGDGLDSAEVEDYGDEGVATVEEEGGSYDDSEDDKTGGGGLSEDGILVSSKNDTVISSVLEEDPIDNVESETGLSVNGWSADSEDTTEASVCKDDPAFLYKDKEGFTCAFLGAVKPDKCLKIHNDVAIGVSSCPEACSMVAECLKAQGASANAVSAGTKTEKEMVEEVSAFAEDVVADDEEEDGAAAASKSDYDASTTAVGEKVVLDPSAIDYDASMDDQGEDDRANNNSADEGEDDNALESQYGTKSMADEIADNDESFGSDSKIVGGLDGDWQDKTTTYDSNGNEVETNDNDIDGNYKTQTEGVTDDDYEDAAGEEGSEEESKDNNSWEDEATKNNDFFHDNDNNDLEDNAQGVNGVEDDWNDNNNESAFGSSNTFEEENGINNELGTGTDWNDKPSEELGVDTNPTWDTANTASNLGSASGGEYFQGGGENTYDTNNMNVPSGQEPNSLGTPSASNNGNSWEYGDEDDGFPVGLFIALLAIFIFFVYRKSQSSNGQPDPRNCASRGGYQRVQRVDHSKRG